MIISKMQLVYCLLFFGVYQSAHSQVNELEIVASAGNSFEANNLFLDWTIGEPIISTLEQPDQVLTQGFHQPIYTIVSLKPLNSAIVSVEVFPNPFIAEVMIKASFSEFETGKLELFNLSGQSIWTHTFEGMDLLSQCPASSLSSGTYLLVLSIPEKKIIHSYKLLKTQ